MAGKKFLAALALLACTTLASGAQAETIKIVLGNAASPPHPFFKAGQMWKEEVEKLTNGKVQVEYLHSRQLGEDRQLIEGVMAGTIDATICSTIRPRLVVIEQPLAPGVPVITLSRVDLGLRPRISVVPFFRGVAVSLASAIASNVLPSPWRMAALPVKACQRRTATST